MEEGLSTAHRLFFIPHAAAAKVQAKRKPQEAAKKAQSKKK